MKQVNNQKPNIIKIPNNSKIFITSIVKETVKEVTAQNIEMQSHKRDYFAETKRLLGKYRDLREFVRDEENYINIYIENFYKEKSKSVVSFKNQKNNCDIDMVYEEGLNKRQEAYLKTKKQVERIESAIKGINSERYFEIIELYFFNNRTTEEIAEKLSIDVTTVNRNRNRLINKISARIFGLDAVIKNQ